MFTAKAERLYTTQLELELGQKLAVLDALNRELGWTPPTESNSDGDADPTKPPNGGKRKSSGRRTTKFRSNH